MTRRTLAAKVEDQPRKVVSKWPPKSRTSNLTVHWSPSWERTQSFISFRTSRDVDKRTHILGAGCIKLSRSSSSSWELSLSSLSSLLAAASVLTSSFRSLCTRNSTIRRISRSSLAHSWAIVAWGGSHRPPCLAPLGPTRFPGLACQSRLPRACVLPIERDFHPSPVLLAPPLPDFPRNFHSRRRTTFAFAWSRGCRPPCRWTEPAVPPPSSELSGSGDLSVRHCPCGHWSHALDNLSAVSIRDLGCGTPRTPRHSRAVPRNLLLNWRCGRISSLSLSCQKLHSLTYRSKTQGTVLHPDLGRF